jgi:hypothetical protein
MTERLRKCGKKKMKKINNIEVVADYDTYFLISQQGNYYIKFSEIGDISVVYDWDVDDLIIAENRTPDQMYQIMLALR